MREQNAYSERVKDVTAHSMFRPFVDVPAHIYDMPHDPGSKTR
jgi:4-hydroxyphenylacetate 3-monooxygenase